MWSRLAGKIQNKERRNLIRAAPVSLLVLSLILFLVFAIRRAWLCDDAYITFRTVDNLVNGYRLTWNTVERVQAYTHPLWMFLLSLVYLFTREIYYSSIILSLVVSFAAVLLFSLRIARTKVHAAFGVLALSLSNAFVDYSTSGLENPLTNLLLVVFFAILFHYEQSRKRVFLLSLIASLSGLNRLDTLLFYLPVIAYELLTASEQVSLRRGFFIAVAGQIPLFLWECFSIFYYGFPFPNTAYAKLSTGIPSGELIRQGFFYLLNSLDRDPITLVVILLGIPVAFIPLRYRGRTTVTDFLKGGTYSIAAGMVLYMLYIIKIGGDFMSGRYFALPLLCAIVIISRFDLQGLAGERYMMAASILLFAGVLILGFSSPSPTIHVGDTGRRPVVDSHGIADERMWYSEFGLLDVLRNKELPGSEAREKGLKARAEAEGDLHAVVMGNTGVFSYYAGPNVFIIDKYALSDPLLARIPAVREVEWRIGHFERVVPGGYVSTVYNLGRIGDEQLATYYDKLALVTRGSLFSKERLLEILRLNTGVHDYLIDHDAYRYPEMVYVALVDLDALEDPQGAASDIASDRISFTDSGIDISLGRVNHAERVSICLEGNDDYEIEYLYHDTILAVQENLAAGEAGEMMCFFFEIPDRDSRTGYDRIRVFPLRGDGVYGVGLIRLVGLPE